MSFPSTLRGSHHNILSRSGPLVVFFSGTNKSDGQFDFWGYAQRSKASCILLNNGLNRWYQSGVPGFGDTVAGTADLLTRWGSTLAASEIICIGASMGGSAAVLYGSMIEARVLAFSFEAHIRHAGSRSAKYIPDDYPLPYPDLKPLILKARKPISSLLGGDDIIDVAEASRLHNVPNLKLTCLRGVDHGVPRHLRAAGSLDQYLDCFIDGAPPPQLPNIDDDLETPAYARSVADAHINLIEKRGSMALIAAEQAIRLRPYALIPRLLAGRAALMLKRPAESLGHLGLAAALDESNTEARLLMGRALRGLQRNRQAADFHARTLAQFPDHHRAMYDRALALWAAGDRTTAMVELGKAVEMAPGIAAYANRFHTWSAIS